MALSDLTQAHITEVEAIAKLLLHGEKPVISEAINRRIIRLVHQYRANIIPGEEDAQVLDKQPVWFLLQVLILMLNEFLSDSGQ